MRQAIRDLYFGKTRSAKLFRYGLLLFDIATILFFIMLIYISYFLWRMYQDEKAER